MKVQATKQGFYDQVLREPGEVFELVNDASGEMPIRMKREYEIGKDGKPTGEYTEEPDLDADGSAVHADFAPDFEEVKGRGAFRGETYTPGWMIQVPDDTEVGIYPPETRFSMKGKEQPRPIQRIVRPDNEPANMPRVTPSKGKVRREHRSA